MHKEWSTELRQANSPTANSGNRKKDIISSASASSSASAWSASQGLAGEQVNFSSATSAVDAVFGFSTVSTTKFHHSNTIERGAPVRSSSVELVYPKLSGAAASGKASKGLPSPRFVVQNLTTATAPPGDADDAVKERSLDGLIPANSAAIPPAPALSDRAADVSFCAVLYASMRKEISMRGWCAASKVLNCTPL